MIAEINTICPNCGEVHVVKVDMDKYMDFQMGKILSQEMNLSKEDTEMLITGICPKCWNKMFNSED